MRGLRKKESFHGLYMNDVSTGDLFLIAVFRKAEICQCGCRGFCTYWCIHDAVLSDLEAGAVGIWMASDYDGQQFPADSVRAVRAGKPMGIILLTTQIRADLPGYTGPMGLRSSSHATHGCP